MKKLVFIFCAALLAFQSTAFAHQERHVHSQWVQQHLGQLNRTIQDLKARVQKLEQGAGGASRTSGSSPGSGSQVLLDARCRPDQRKLCQQSCSAGWKIANASCIGNGKIGQTLHKPGAVTCYCYDKNDPDCAIQGITAMCSR